MDKSGFIFKYRVRNWRGYNQALLRRGSLTVWVDQQSIAAWRGAARPTIPPRRKARMSHDRHPPQVRVERDAVVRCIREEGRYRWRTRSGATRQSLAENAVSRFKGLVGGRLDARRFDS